MYTPDIDYPGVKDMIWFVLLGFLAAFGLLSAMWAIFGFLLPGSRRCAVVLLCEPDAEWLLLQRLLWLRQLGLLRCQIFLSGRGLTEQQRRQILQYNDIEICDSAQPGE